jgi:serralysin
MTMLHEIGHALGLKHSFESFLGTPVLPIAEENRRYTVMSYVPPPGTTGEAATPMLYDIAALQLLYGTNSATRAGNTVYTRSVGAPIVETIWDGGGIDLIEAATQDRAFIDLREGMFSTIGSHNLAIAYGTVIENARGGAGHDLLNGNNSANRLDGGAGINVLVGHGGADRFVYANPNAGRSSINDFIKGEDLIVLDRAAFGLSGTGSLAALGVEFVLGGASLGSGPAIIYDEPNRMIWWDADGGGGGAPVQLGDVRVIPQGPSSTVLFDQRGWNATATGDFNGDGIDDLVWRNPTTGQNILWRMGEGGGVVATGDLGTFTGWEIGALGDFNADGTADILWSNTATGRNFIWLLDDGVPMRSYFGGDIPGWTLAASADLNGDGATDLLWRNIASGENYLWLFDDGQPYSTYWLGTIPGWQIGGAGDVDGDGTDDLLWQHQTTGEAYLWLMGEGQPRASWSLGVRREWKIAGLGDFDGNGTEDILWHHASGQHTIWRMTGGRPNGEQAVTTFAFEEAAGIGDYTGDGIADIVTDNLHGRFRMIDVGQTTLRPEDFVIGNKDDDMVAAGSGSYDISMGGGFVNGWLINVEDPVVTIG